MTSVPILRVAWSHQSPPEVFRLSNEPENLLEQNAQSSNRHFTRSVKRLTAFQQSRFLGKTEQREISRVPEDPHEPHHAKAGRAGPSPGHCHRGTQRILKTLSDGRLRSTAHLGCRAALAATKRVTNPCQCWVSIANPSDVAGIGRQRCAATSQMTKTCDIPADVE